MRIAICDDVLSDLEALNNAVSEYYSSKNTPVIIDKFSNPETLLNKFFLEGNNYYNVFILDIVMQQNGIDVAKKIAKINPYAIIIFQSSSPEFAVDAFRVKALDYILKPLNKQQVNECLNRVSSLLETTKKEIIQVKNSDLNLVNIEINQINYIESSDRKIVFHMIDETTVSTISMRTKFLESIPFNYEEKNFLNCHASFIVNMNQIKSIVNFDFIMFNGDTVPISKRMLKQTKEKYFKYLIGD